MVRTQDKAPDWKKGDRVQVFFDDEPYKGRLAKVKRNKATVEFDDGDVLELEFAPLLLQRAQLTRDVVPVLRVTRSSASRTSSERPAS